MEIKSASTVSLTKVILFTVVLALVYKIVSFIQQYRKWSAISAKVTQFGPFHSLWGNLHLFSSPTEYVEKANDLVRRTGTKMYCVWYTSMLPNFSLVHPDTVRCLMKSSEPKPTKSLESPYRFIKPWIGDGLTVSSGHKWQRNRQLLTYAFHFDILKPYIIIYNKSADVLLDKLAELSKTKKTFDISSVVMLATLDSMLKCAFSLEENIQRDWTHHPYVKAVGRLSELLIKRYFSPWYHRDFIYYLSPDGREFKRLTEYVHEFANKLISSRRMALKEDPDQLKKRHLDFLDVLLTAKDEEGRGLEVDDIREEVDTFLFAGYDTTSSAINWTIYCLGKYQDEQERVYKEVEDVCIERKVIELEDFSKLKYTTMFLKEVIRLYSPIPAISRCLTKPMTFDGVEIPENYAVDIRIDCLHRHPDIWKNPDEFLPERFSDENMKNRDPYSYVPFSAGPRNCIGQNFAMNELKVFVTRFVKRFKVHLDAEHKYIPDPEVVLRAKYGIKVSLEER